MVSTTLILLTGALRPDIGDSNAHSTPVRFDGCFWKWESHLSQVVAAKQFALQLIKQRFYSNPSRFARSLTHDRIISGRNYQNDTIIGSIAEQVLKGTVDTRKPLPRIADITGTEQFKFNIHTPVFESVLCRI